MNEVEISPRGRPEVAYRNELNNLQFGKVSSKQLDILMALIYKAKNKGGQDVFFERKEFLRLAKMDGSKAYTGARIENEIDTLVQKLFANAFRRTKVTKEHEDGTLDYVVDYQHFFRYIRPVYEGGTMDETTGKIEGGKFNGITFSISDEFADLFNYLDSGGFTAFLLEEYTGKLTTKYSKALFPYLKEWRTKGQTYMSMEELKKKLNVPTSLDKAGNGVVIRKVFSKTTINNLESVFPGFKYKLVRSTGTGNAIKGVNMFWRPERPNEDIIKLNRGDLDDVIRD